MILNFSRAGRRWLAALFLPWMCGGASAHPEEFDIVVYGGTSGGITAAVQAAKMGKRVALVSPTKHLGGLSSSGLGFTDLGDVEILGGLSREFYHRVYLHYQSQPNWSSVKTMSGQGGPAFNATYETGSIFEPKVAEKIFNDLLAENRVPVFTGLLDLSSGVVKSGQRITALKMEDGRLFRGKMFIDAGYEGDVLAGAGVSFTIGREANSKYGETISGVQSSSSGNQVIDGISPWIVKDNPNSGRLPGIEESIAPNGTGDEKLQAYCFRMCLTSLATNRVLIPQPPGYNEADYELVLRGVEAGQTSFFKLDSMPNRKTDSNNTGGISTDFIGKNYGVDENGNAWNWATLNHQQRADLAKAHENYQRGLVWTLQNHPRVKARHANGLYAGWGLPADEFIDNGNWPDQLYVREARRMISDYVMTQKNCSGSVVAPDSVGMAAYTMDSHHVQRYVRSGMVKNEGDVQRSTAGPYPVSYRSIIPKVGECENLLVPWCLSSSHMAFGSIRMEPVFMTLGQSSATAAAIAINDGISVQQVPYEKLAIKLRADGQALNLGSQDVSISGIVVDNTEAQLVGEWTPSTATAGYFGSNYLVDGNIGKGTKSVRYTPNIPVAGWYQVTLRWSALDNRATNVPVKVFHRDGVSSATMNQTVNGGVWNLIGNFYFEVGTSGSLLIETTGTNNNVIADAAQWIASGANSVVEITSYIPSIVRDSISPGEFIFSRKGSSAEALTVNYTIGGTAGAGSVSPALTGSITIPAGVREAKIPLTALQTSVPQGTKLLQLTVATGTGYLIGVNSSASITLKDSPFEAWRFANFSATELANAAISGPTADPDRDGRTNLLEFFNGGIGQTSDGISTTQLQVQNGRLYLNVQRHIDAQDLKMRVWESSDLLNWSRTPELALPVQFERVGAYQKLGIPLRASNPLGEGRKFFQLRIEQ